jgi:DnaJ-class molecular chaperone
MADDLYRVLEVRADADARAITTAYRRMARRWHPDANPDDPSAEERFKEVAAAYDVLGDPAKRARYDRERRATPTRTPPRARGTRGPDHEATLDLRLEDAVLGTTTSLTLSDGSRDRDVRVRIPAGVADGRVIRVPGKGGASPDGGPAGDLYLTVRLAPHAVFGRSGRDLTVTVPVTFPEAALGADVDVPTIDGRKVGVRIPAGTSSGRVLRVRGRGVPDQEGRGDLLVTVQIVVPTTLTAEERRAIEVLAANAENPRL